MLRPKRSFTVAPAAAAVSGLTHVPTLVRSSDDSNQFAVGREESFAANIGDDDTTEDEREFTNAPARMSTTITVAVRKRPKIRLREDRENDVVRSEGDAAITVYAPKMRVDLTPVIEPSTFTFDFVFDERCANDDVYRQTTKPLLDTVRRGGSAVVFAFGQTGSGKTYTMLGHSDTDPGIYSLAVKDMLTLVDHQMTLAASFYEVYGSKLFDLLNDRCEVKVLQDEYKNIHIVGLKEKPVDSTEDLTDLMKAGQQLRACGTTSANDRSSRSHAVLVLNLRQRRGDDELFGRMTFVDLAGSERAADTASADKQTRREGAEINKSLLALKECIRAMGLRKRHIPFRGSKLTQILRESFIGNCQTCVIANVSPCQSHCEDTLNTLRYADRIKSLKGSNTGDDGEAPIPCQNCGLPIFIGDRHVCRKVITQCPHCRQEMDKEKYDVHLLECKEAPIRCPHCNERFLQGDLQKHNRKCAKFPTRCGPCGEVVPRNLMEKHVQTECMQSKGACRYCRGLYLRMDLAQHEEGCGHMQICCHYCLMVMKKARMESHLAECPNNPLRLQKPRQEAPQLVRRPSNLNGRQRSTSPQPPVGLQPVRRGRPIGSARTRSPSSRPTNVSAVPQPPASPTPTPAGTSVGATGVGAALRPRHLMVANSQTSCKYCARFVQPAALSLHIKNDCMYVPVRCPYESYGCKWESLRAKLAAHILDSTSEHLELVQRYAEDVALENASLKKRIANLGHHQDNHPRTEEEDAVELGNDAEEGTTGHPAGASALRHSEEDALPMSLDRLLGMGSSQRSSRGATPTTDD